MFAGHSTSSQRFNSIANSLRWLARAENVPDEIQHCLQLIPLVSRDAHHLCDLRNENLAVLRSTPSELHRINDLLATCARSLADVESMLEKYRPQEYEGKVQASSTITWMLADSKTFAVRSRNLQIHHQNVLNEISHLKMYRMMDPMLQMAEKADRQFENLDLLKGLFGNNGKTSTTDIHAPQLCRESPTTKSEPTSQAFDIMEHPVKSTSQFAPASEPPVPENSSDSLSQPPPYAPLRPSIVEPKKTASKAPSIGSNDSSRPRMPSTPKAVAAELPRSPVHQTRNELSVAPRSYSMPISQPGSGLKSLFQAPVPLALPSPDQSPPSRPNPTKHRSLGAFPTPVVSPMSSMASLQSEASIPTAAYQILAPTLETARQISKQELPYQRLRPQSFSTAKVPSPLQTVDDDDAQNSKPVPQGRHRGLSQLFVYRPRPIPDQQTAQNSEAHTPNDLILFELEGSNPDYVQATEIRIKRAQHERNAEESRSRLGSDASASQASLVSQRSDTTTSSVAEVAASRRDEIDAAAWQRRTQLFQVPQMKESRGQ
ncbi:uncharacterized protein BCR38DRAFT_423532 [Pseudomassariella vexata]|uniref:Uncharacterized protein n=1 Tax=Pseudomassariella vexata TaxID=1141098 RepID=A0A1Y2EAE2_9PEZI|nr:uncharacterized protein BCR38DRAFT_423532 [Pseudomassariella vexata]ORY68541.1 hypothetical protein BCR38DRAFT_423532 [Pseudomassariella vexata]